MPAIDVVIVNYNAGAWLPRVAALHAQTFRDFRVTIVDNGSTDGSLADLPPGPTPVEIIRAGKNLGFAAGNNLAIRSHVAAEWLVLLNPDAFPRPDWLEEFLGAARANPEYSFFGCRMLDANDPTRLDGVGDVYHVSGLPGVTVMVVPTVLRTIPPARSSPHAQRRLSTERETSWRRGPSTRISSATSRTWIWDFAFDSWVTVVFMYRRPSLSTLARVSRARVAIFSSTTDTAI